MSELNARACTYNLVTSVKKMEIQILKPDICRFSTAPNDRNPFSINCEDLTLFFWGFFGIGYPETNGNQNICLKTRQQRYPVEVGEKSGKV